MFEIKIPDKFPYRSISLLNPRMIQNLSRRITKNRNHSPKMFVMIMFVMISSHVWFPPSRVSTFPPCFLNFSLINLKQNLPRLINLNFPLMIKNPNDWEVVLNFPLMIKNPNDWEVVWFYQFRFTDLLKNHSYLFNSYLFVKKIWVFVEKKYNEFLSRLANFV